MKYSAMDSYIRQLQRSRGISLQDLARMLGYSSPTSLTRIMQEATSRNILQKFSERLCACQQLHLTPQEKCQLDDLIELRDVGDHDYLTMIALRRLLRGEYMKAMGPLTMYTPDGKSSSFIAHYGMMRIKRMIVLNSENVPIFADLQMLMQRHPFPVEHLLYSGTSAMHTVHTLHAVMPLLYQDTYSCSTFSLDNDPQTFTRGLITADMILCEYEAQDRTLHTEIAVFTTPSTGRIQDNMPSLDHLMLLLPPRDSMHPVSVRINGGDFINYNRFCAELEEDHAVFRFKPDLGVDQIPCDILLDAVSSSAPEEVLLVLDTLTEIFRTRQQRMLTKKEPQYHVMKRRAMWQFVQTGRISDHLWCCRPFTKPERIAILRFLRDQIMTNEDFHLRFIKNDDMLLDDEIILYEDKALSIIKPGTDYDFSNQHAEIMIVEPDFLRVFRRFFMESTLRYRVETQEAAAAEIDRMIDSLLNR